MATIYRVHVEIEEEIEEEDAFTTVHTECIETLDSEEEAHEFISKITQEVG